MSTQLRLSRSGFRVIFALGILGACAGQDMYRTVPGAARQIQAGPAGSVYYLGRMEVDRGYCTRVQRLTRSSDGAVVRETVSGCLPFQRPALKVHPDGSMTIFGARPLTPLTATPGAVSLTVAGDSLTLAVVRLSPTGQMQWTAMFSAPDPYYSEVWEPRVLAGEDGSLIGAATVKAGTLPTTANAVQRVSGGRTEAVWLFRLSADGSQLLYGTYLADSSANVSLSDMALSAESDIFVGGLTQRAALGSSDFPATPGSFEGPPRLPGSINGFVARFHPESSTFRYIAQFGGDLAGQPRLAPGKQGRVAVGASLLSGTFPSTRGALDQNIRGHEAFVFEISPDGSSLEFSTGLASYPFLTGLERNENDDLLVTGWAYSALPITANAVQLPKYFGAFAAALTRDGKRLLFWTGLGDQSASSDASAVRVGRTLYVPSQANVGDAALEGRLTAEPDQTPDRRSWLLALPDVIDTCMQANPPALIWDTRDPAVTSAEIRRDRPDGPLIAEGLTGRMEVLDEAATYYFLNTSGGPFGARNMLGTAVVRRYRGLRCADVSTQTGSLQVFRNPLNTCRDGQRAFLVGLGSGYLEVHVGSVVGPVVTAGIGRVETTTGAWVDNGLPFYLVSLNSGAAIASERSYLVPDRFCLPGTEPAPAIRATRDCTQKDRFTLAWWSGHEITQVRQNEPNGPVVATSSEEFGLVDVSAGSSTEYWLVGWRAGQWKTLTSTTANPASKCEQGTLH